MNEVPLYSIDRTLLDQGAVLDGFEDPFLLPLACSEFHFLTPNSTEEIPGKFN